MNKHECTYLELEQALISTNRHVEYILQFPFRGFINILITGAQV